MHASKVAKLQPRSLNIHVAPSSSQTDENVEKRGKSHPLGQMTYSE
jgi:hypothetical protein